MTFFDKLHHLRTERLGLLFWLGLLCLPLAALLAGSVFEWIGDLGKQGWGETPCRVVATTGTRGATARPAGQRARAADPLRVSYEYTVAGTTYAGSREWTAPGTPVTVYYDPAAPAVHALDAPFRWGARLTSGFAVLCYVLAAGGALLLASGGWSSTRGERRG